MTNLMHTRVTLRAPVYVSLATVLMCRSGHRWIHASTYQGKAAVQASRERVGVDHDAINAPLIVVGVCCHSAQTCHHRVLSTGFDGMHVGRQAHPSRPFCNIVTKMLRSAKVPCRIAFLKLTAAWSAPSMFLGISMQSDDNTWQSGRQVF